MLQQKFTIEAWCLGNYSGNWQTKALRSIKPICGVFMDQLSFIGVGFAVAIFGLACFMSLKLASKKAYH